MSNLCKVAIYYFILMLAAQLSSAQSQDECKRFIPFFSSGFLSFVLNEAHQINRQTKYFKQKYLRESFYMQNSFPPIH